MNTIAERLVRCDREILWATVQNSQPHTEAEHFVILRYEMDRQIERERILSEQIWNPLHSWSAKPAADLSTRKTQTQYGV